MGLAFNVFISFLASIVLLPSLLGQVPKAPARSEGEGPFEQLIIRGATLIDGTGAPPIGPVDIVIENNRIEEVRFVGVPRIPIDPTRRPSAGSGTEEIDAEGAYVLPGLFDAHAHIGFTLAGGEALKAGMTGTPAEYVFELWMGHGVTTIREPGCGNGLGWTLDQKDRSAKSKIAAPRIEAYVRFAQGHDVTISTAEQARA
jgi:N-acyl-D-aspartate/D-glutamate deacylase